MASELANRPVNFVSWGDAARLCNWLYNGQPTGSQDLSTTEDGSYYLNGATTDAQLVAVTRKTNATWVIPSEDEWYKAAYHKNDGMTGNYFDYPTSSDSMPTPESPPGGSNSANFYSAVGHTTDAGAYTGSDSPYGTFDQGGNVTEWNEAVLLGSYRGLLNGSFAHGDSLHASHRGYSPPSREDGEIGFRAATDSAG